MKSKKEVKILFLSATIGNSKELILSLNKSFGKWDYIIGDTYQSRLNNIIIPNIESSQIYEILKILFRNYFAKEEYSSTIIFVPYISMANYFTTKFKKEFEAESDKIECHY